MPARSPLDALSRRLHAGPRRRGIVGVVQRVALVVLPRPRIPAPLLNPPGAETLAARERARRALVEARQAMSGVIGTGPSMPEESAIVGAVLPDLERLQAFLEESDRDRAALREEVSGLRGMLQQVSAQLDVLQRSIAALPRSAEPVGQASSERPTTALPADEEGVESPVGGTASLSSRKDSADLDGTPPQRAGAAAERPSFPGAHVEPDAGPTADALPEAAPPAEPSALPEEDITVLRERVLRALRERVFAAGTVGTRIEIRPALAPPEAESVLARMNEETLVELAEEGLPAEDATSLRVTLRAPLRWEQFSALLEAALGLPLAPGSVGWSQGVVRVEAPDRQPDPPGQVRE